MHEEVQRHWGRQVGISRRCYVVVCTIARRLDAEDGRRSSVIGSSVCLFYTIIKRLDDICTG